MILKHWELEKRLTAELLDSNVENRWEVFEQCYRILYSELWWLNQYVGMDNKISPSRNYEVWIDLIGQPPKRVYEIGSGKGELISYLAGCGYECRATEITYERGQKITPEHRNISWNISDGVHLEQFEAPNSYDIVISDQVIEHLHPSDMYEHFKGVLSILSGEGKYIFRTPHSYLGPADISKVFRCDKPSGMHLREYTYQELNELLERAGFKDIRAVLNIPVKITQVFGVKPRVSRRHLAFLCVIEMMVSVIPHRRLRRKAGRVLMFILSFPNVFIVAKK